MNEMTFKTNVEKNGKTRWYKITIGFYQNKMTEEEINALFEHLGAYRAPKTPDRKTET